MKILRLNLAGQPINWLHWEEAVCMYARDLVVWSMGDVVRQVQEDKYIASLQLRLDPFQKELARGSLRKQVQVRDHQSACRHGGQAAVECGCGQMPSAPLNCRCVRNFVQARVPSVTPSFSVAWMRVSS